MNAPRQVIHTCGKCHGPIHWGERIVAHITGFIAHWSCPRKESQP